MNTYKKELSTEIRITYFVLSIFPFLFKPSFRAKRAVHFFFQPWFRAKLYLAWYEYQDCGEYKAIATRDGVPVAVQVFLRDEKRWQELCRKRVQRHPAIRLFFVFLPWVFQKPPLFDLIAREGLAKKVLEEV